MALTTGMDTAFTMRHMRVGVRLNSRVNLRVDWNENGHSLSADGYTVDISPRGCLAIVAQVFPVGQKLVVTNVSSGKSTDATLIWRGHEGRLGWEFGLELDDPATDFWGVEF